METTFDPLDNAPEPEPREHIPLSYQIASYFRMAHEHPQTFSCEAEEEHFYESHEALSEEIHERLSSPEFARMEAADDMAKLLELAASYIERQPCLQTAEEQPAASQMVKRLRSYSSS